MTKLGNALVIANLVFSFITAALIVMVYTTGTNWKKGYDEVYKQVLVARAAWSADHASLTDKYNEKEAQFKNLEENYKGEQENHKTTKTALADAENKMKGIQDISQTNANNIVIVTAELERRKEEVKQLQEVVDQQAKQIGMVAATAKKERDLKVEAQLQLQSATDRNANLLVTVENLVKEVERYQGKRTAPATGGPLTIFQKNPPPDDVRGVVKVTDTATGLLTISIGSDAGLSRGNTLEVYRLKPTPTYLGTIQIMDVRAHEAVGKSITAQRRGLIQPGDEVAANILGKQ